MPPRQETAASASYFIVVCHEEKKVAHDFYGAFPPGRAASQHTERENPDQDEVEKCKNAVQITITLC